MSTETDGEIWNRNMRAALRQAFPWAAKPDAGRWYLYDSRGACLARFNLDSGHGSRLAAAAPDLLVALQNILNGIDTKAIRVETDQDETWANAMQQARDAVEKSGLGKL